MKYDKIMAGGNLDNIMERLNGCRALLCALCEIAGTSRISEEALFGVTDLLEMICRDFQADIDAAEDYIGETVTDVLLASPIQIRFLEARGFQHAETWSFEEAKSMVDRIAANGWRVPPGIIPTEYEPEGTEART